MYLDPGTGSMIIQAIIAVFAALSAGFFVFRGKIKNLFKKKNTQQDAIDANDDEEATGDE